MCGYKCLHNRIVLKKTIDELASNSLAITAPGITTELFNKIFRNSFFEISSWVYWCTNKK